MPLPNSYTIKPGSIPAYFDAMLQAGAPERFSVKFLEGLEFKSTNDRAIIGVLKELGFLDTDAAPTKRYFEFLDKSQSRKVLATGIREAFSELFALNKDANKLSTDEVKGKLRTLYAGTKNDNLIQLIARTFTALCEYADFDPITPVQPTTEKKVESLSTTVHETSEHKSKEVPQKTVTLDSLQYHINIVLPESRDQAVYDAIFKSLRDHLK